MFGNCGRNGVCMKKREESSAWRAKTTKQALEAEGGALTEFLRETLGTSACSVVP